jgi:predicted metal-dependent phosphotriesterase family hydrolase
MTHIQTVLGPVDIDALALILPHEHLFIDQRPQEALGQRGGYIDDVLPVMMPYLDQSWNAGVTCLIECTPTGMQDPAAIEALARHTQVSIVMPVGLYKQSFPEDKLALSDAEVTGW